MPRNQNYRCGKSRRSQRGARLPHFADIPGGLKLFSASKCDPARLRSNVSWRRPDCLADDAVSCELLSAHCQTLHKKGRTDRFAARMKQKRKVFPFNKKGRGAGPRTATRSDFKGLQPNSLRNGTGNFAAITGNFFGITGNLIERATKALICYRTSNWHGS